MHLIPKVKHLEIRSGFLENKSIFIATQPIDSRLIAVIDMLPVDPKGTPLELIVDEGHGEAYELTIEERKICIHANGQAGAFYAVQTLRQIFEECNVPCLYVKDWPDFPYRGFYQDVTRGKIASVETIKQLIDRMAYYKLNSLQLYVEHVFEFEETKGLWDKTGYLTKAELQEIGTYCHDNFIEFIPSLATFGHMHDILEQEQYRYLRVNQDDLIPANLWQARMNHHTINPFFPESIELVKSLIDQYAPCFESDKFNICCDETFDLKRFENEGHDVGAVYLDFVNKIIAHIQKLGKKTMMWGDILLEHPTAISELPDDILLLNWDYYSDKVKMEDKISKLAESGKKQIVCPGTTTWNRFCEHVDVEEFNITQMTELGHRYGAIGVLNTNWGDWANICSLDLGMYGMVFGAEKSWSVNTTLDDHFYAAVNALLYKNNEGYTWLKRISRFNCRSTWVDFAENYYKHQSGLFNELKFHTEDEIKDIQNEYLAIAEALTCTSWGVDEYRQELLLSAEAVCVMAELNGILAGYRISRVTNTENWLERYRIKWLEKNKESELQKIEHAFRYFESVS